MRIVHLSTHDTAGGAARAAFRLHEGLHLAGVDSRMFVSKASTQRPDVISFRPRQTLLARLLRLTMREWNKRDMRRYSASRPRGLERFSSERGSDRFPDIATQLPPHDILHVHWIAGFVDYSGLLASHSPEIPIVWTLHDMNPFTGGCHFAGTCAGYLESCGSCPQLGSTKSNDLSREVWRRKERALAAVLNRMHFVAPSRWMADRAQTSSLLRRKPITTIPYGVDTETFRPRPKRAAWQALGLSESSRVLLFVSNHLGTRRKGLHLLDAALSKIQTNDTILLAIGYGQPEFKAKMPFIRLEHVNSDRLLSAVYSAADVLLLPSLEDNLPNTVLEALACGTPTIGFDVGGVSDVVRSGENGLLVPPGDVDSLAVAIRRLLTDDRLLAAFSERCRKEAIAEYRMEKQASRYADLYQSLLARDKLNAEAAS